MTRDERDEQSWIANAAEAAFRQAADKVIERAKQTGTPVIVWRNGRIEEIPADEFQPDGRDR